MSSPTYIDNPSLHQLPAEIFNYLLEYATETDLAAMSTISTTGRSMTQLQKVDRLRGYMVSGDYLEGLIMSIRYRNRDYIHLFMSKLQTIPKKVYRSLINTGDFPLILSVRQDFNSYQPDFDNWLARTAGKHQSMETLIYLLNSSNDKLSIGDNFLAGLIYSGHVEDYSGICKTLRKLGVMKYGPLTDLYSGLYNIHLGCVNKADVHHQIGLYYGYHKDLILPVSIGRVNTAQGDSQPQQELLSQLRLDALTLIRDEDEQVITNIMQLDRESAFLDWESLVKILHSEGYIHVLQLIKPYLQDKINRYTRIMDITGYISKFKDVYPDL